MKKCVFLAVFILMVSALYSQELIGGKLKLTIEPVNYSNTVFIENVYTKHIIRLSFNHNIEAIFDINDNSSYNSVRLGTADISSNNFMQIITSFLQRQMNDDDIWGTEANKIAEKIREHFIKKHFPDMAITSNEPPAPSSPAPLNQNAPAFLSNIPEKIMSGGTISNTNLVNFLLSQNPALNSVKERVSQLVDLYIAEADYEGVNYEIAFAQMCYHTNFLSYRQTLSRPENNNFCGLTIMGSPEQEIYFRNMEEGVIAHIQHLKGYATSEPLKKNIVDPRYNQIRLSRGLGTSPTIDGLSNKWAGNDYSNKIKSILGMLYSYVR